jgi:hypothetical protein
MFDAWDPKDHTILRPDGVDYLLSKADFVALASMTASYKYHVLLSLIRISRPPIV